MFKCPICDKVYKCNICSYEKHIESHTKKDEIKKRKEEEKQIKKIKKEEEKRIKKINRDIKNIVKKVKKVKVKVPDKNAELDMMGSEDNRSSLVRQKKAYDKMMQKRKRKDRDPNFGLDPITEEGTRSLRKKLIKSLKLK